MTQALKINRILDLVELTAVQVGQLSLETAEVKEEIALVKVELAKKADKADLLGKADKDDIVYLKASLESRLDDKADKSDITYLKMSLEAKLDDKADKSDIQSLKESINQNDMVFAEMLLDHKTRPGKLERRAFRL